jgi:hypothetical protein
MFNILSHKEMQIKMISRFQITSVRMTVIKKTTNAGEDVGKKEPLHSVRQNVSSCSHSGNQYEDSSEY